MCTESSEHRLKRWQTVFIRLDGRDAGRSKINGKTLEKIEIDIDILSETR